MMNSLLPRTLITGASTAILALLLGMATVTGSAQKKTAAPQPSRPAATHSSSSGTSHGTTGGSAQTHGASHGPTGGSANHGSTAGGIHPHSTGGGGTANHGSATGGANNPNKNSAHVGNTTHGNTPAHGSTTGGGVKSNFKPGKEGGTGGHSTVPGYGRTPAGVTNHPLKGGASYTTRAGGHPGGFHDPAHGISTHHNLNGGFHGSVMHPDHSGVYFAHGRAGYAQHPYSWHGSSFASRSYFWHGHPYYGYYHGWGWRGGYYNVYAPGFFFGVGFYGWAYHPWYRPIGWGWGWGGSPWFGYYGGWFNPYPTYAAPAFWLTDYLIAQNLQAAYAAHEEGGEQAVAGGEGVMLTPEVKDQIAEEVRNQIAIENQEAQQTAQGQAIDPGSSGIGRMLNDGKHHIFVAASAIDVVDAGSGQECAISDGDVLQVAKTPAPTDTSADLVVLASKGGNECQKAATVTVNFSDLQEMQNSMRQNLDNGLKELHAKQGTGGIPAAPPSATAAPTEAPYAAVAPPPDPNDAQQIQQQEQSSQEAEQQAAKDANGGGTAQQ